MSLQIKKKEVDLEDNLSGQSLTKYGFGLKLTSFTAMLGWVGMILSSMFGLGAITLFAALIDFERRGHGYCSRFHYHYRYNDWTVCGLFAGFGTFFSLVSPVWFYLSFRLRKQVIENNLPGMTKTLKIICYIQATFSILVTGPLMVFPILKIVGIARRKTKFINIYIIYTIIMSVLANLCLIGWHIFMAYAFDLGFIFICGVLECIILTLLCFYGSGFIITLHTIMEYNENNFTIFKNKHSYFENQSSNFSLIDYNIQNPNGYC